MREVILRVLGDKEVRVPLAQVELFAAQKTSLMPEGLLRDSDGAAGRGFVGVSDFAALMMLRVLRNPRRSPKKRPLYLDTRTDTIDKI